MRLSACFAIASFVTSSACGGSGGGGPTETLTQPTIPAARSGHAMTYDDARRVVLMFGGTGASTLGDLWSWNGTSWTRLSTSGPPPRDDAVLAFDGRRQRLVLFGGRSGQTLLADTWEWDGTAWSKLAIDSAPSPRFWHSTAFDSARGVTVLFGGYDGSDAGETWEWDGVGWVLRSKHFP